MLSTQPRKSVSRITRTFGVLMIGLTITAVTSAPASAQSTTPPATKTSKKVAKAEAKAAKTVKREEAETRGERVNAKDERKLLMKQILLTKAQKASAADIAQRYDTLMKDLDTQLKKSEKDGKADPALVAKAEALQLRERTDLRALLSGAQLAQFDRNVQVFTGKK